MSSSFRVCDCYVDQQCWALASSPRSLDSTGETPGWQSPAATSRTPITTMTAISSHPFPVCFTSCFSPVLGFSRPSKPKRQTHRATVRHLRC